MLGEKPNLSRSVTLRFLFRRTSPKKELADEPKDKGGFVGSLLYVFQCGRQFQSRLYRVGLTFCIYQIGSSSSWCIKPENRTRSVLPAESAVLTDSK